MKQGCCSENCEKKSSCGKYYLNLKEPAYLESWATFGSCTITTHGIENETWACGALGNYAMYEPKDT